jgi:predicted nucleic acid-binding protein
VAALVDTNVLVYRYDSRFPDKQRIAARLLRWGADTGALVVPHQAIVEFVAATTRPMARGERSILTLNEALLEAEELLAEYEVVYPHEAIVRLALQAATNFQLSWFDAHLWAYAEFYELPHLYSEDFEHDRSYGKVRIINPFRPASDLPGR